MKKTYIFVFVFVFFLQKHSFLSYTYRNNEMFKKKWTWFVIFTYPCYGRNSRSTTAH